MKRVLIISGHFPGQKRRSSMLWVSDHLQAMGWHVTFATVGYSSVSRLRRDRRLAALPAAPAPGEHHLSPSLTHVFHYSPLHPFSARSRYADAALHFLHRSFVGFWRDRLARPARRAGLIIVESGPQVMLGPTLSRLAPGAARIYRVNDDIGLLGLPGWLVRDEANLAGSFTRISSASPLLLSRFVAHQNRTLDPMGVPADLFEGSFSNPYPTRSGVQAVCAGTSQIDPRALARIAAKCPDWRLHIFGRMPETPGFPANVTCHGETAFKTVLAYTAHADIGLAPYRDRPGIEYQATNSNRLLLYRRFGLPVLVPGRLSSPAVPTGISYDSPGWKRRCETARRQPEALPDWRALARALAQNPVTVPPFEVTTPPAMER